MPNNVVFLGSDLDESAQYAQLVAYLKTFFTSLGSYPARVGILDTEDGGAWAIMPWYPHGAQTGLESGVATTIITYPDAVSGASGKIWGQVTCRKGADYQIRTFEFSFAAMNDSGGTLDVSTFDYAIDGGLALPAAVTTGTLTLAFTAVQDGNSLLIKVTPTTSLSSPTSFEIEFHYSQFNYNASTGIA